MKIEFTRGGNPFKTLNIGKRAQIENWFKTWAPNAKYEIDDNSNITVKNSLWFRYFSAISLPNNLHVDGYLDISETNITSLPNNLYVKRYLDIRETKITSLPNNLHVDGKMYKDF